MTAPERAERTNDLACEEVAQSLEGTTGPLEPARLKAAADHCRRCPKCLDRFLGLARAVLSLQEEITCAECRAAWPALLETRRGHEGTPDRLRLAEAHLSRCQPCSRAFASLSELLRLEELGALEEPASYPRFDLSFLAPAPLWSRSATPDRAGREVRELIQGTALRARVLRRGLAASFVGLAGGLRPVPMAAQATRGSSTARGERLVLADPGANVSITLSLQGAGKGRCHLGIEVHEREPDRPLEGRVSLRGDSGEEVTPLSEGRATFADLGPAHYVLEVLIPSPGGTERRWRLPITVEVV